MTGGAGYIGSHICKALRACGVVPVSFDNLSSGNRWAVSWGPLVVGDVRDQAQLAAAFAEYRPRAVIHLAGLISVGQSVHDPSSYYSNNLIGIWTLLEAMRRHEITQLVFSSSASVYGEPENMPIREVHPRRPMSPYAMSKLASERMLADYAQAYGVRSVSLRYFNAAGADPDAMIGEAHHPETHLVPLVIRACLVPEARLDLFGTDYPTPDGTAVRDYVHVSDLADAHVRALDYLWNGGETTALNVGTGVGYSVRQVIEATTRLVGRSVRVHEAARRSGDSASLVADPAEAQRVLGWRPRNADIEAIVESALVWHRREGFGAEIRRTER